YGSKRSMRAAWLSLRALLQLGVALLLAIVCVIRPTKAFTWLRTAASQLGKIAYFLEKNMLAYGETVGHTSIKEKT
ncbi:MAG: hypothetical protein KGM99_20800, partial [Burkholderiales bacterium]|nr:hypothetical protein [Burkholderiales bacterium]